MDDVAEELRDRILAGELEPGAKIRQQECAELLGVSRTPLREAFQRLEADGWVSLKARQGAIVRSLSAEEADEIFTLRILLETFAGRLGAIAHDVDREPLAEAALAAARGEQQEGSDDANRRFHELIYGFDESGTPTELRTEIRGHWARALRYRRLYWERPGAAAASAEHHLTILEAWRRRDPEATERAIAAHLLSALDDITRGLDAARPLSAALAQLASRYDLPSQTTKRSRRPK